ncbi:MAG TPA: TetR family transcriptional regulator [Phenylobacterium sp.]|nr:TetR family transcriptional regulator [Phenylobacterium sp.]
MANSSYRIGPVAVSPAPEPEGELVNKRRRQARSVETRAKILKAATQEFAEVGFEGATTRSIAHRANLRHALVLYHFETKTGLWQAVMRDIVFWFNDAFERRLAGLEGVEDPVKLRLLQADFIRMAAAHPELHWLMSHEAGRTGERLDWLMGSLVGGTFTLFGELIANVQKTGHYVQGNPYHLHYLFLGAAARIFMLAAEAERFIGRSPFEPEFVEEHVRLCAELFFREPADPVKRRSR